MARFPKKSTPATCRNAITGAIACPKCKHSPMVPMASGKGFRCGIPGNRFNGTKWSICDGVVWNNAKPMFQKKDIPRAQNFPIIKNPTDEQKAVRKLMGQTPSQRGGRAIIIDAGPGTGKTTTISWGCEALHKRLGNLKNYPVVAFNVVAKDVLTAKLPAEVPDVATINSWHAQAQGFRYNQYDSKKLSTMFKEMTDHLPKDEKPRLGVVGKVVERMRDVCLFNNDVSDVSWWNQAFVTICERFPSMAKKIQQDKNALKLCQEYIPLLTVNALAVKTKIDIQEQFTRPVSEACNRTGWRMRWDCVSKHAKEWTNDDVQHFAKLIRSIQLPSVIGMIVDESQDLSLAKLAVILAQTWQNKSELILIGDDNNGEPLDDDYKAGQAIFGWNGAFPGVLNLAARLWAELTGEEVVRTALTVTFRHGPETCDAYRPLNKVIKSGLPAGVSQVWRVNADQAFTAWLAIPEGQTALWITRTNAPLSGLLKDTIKAQAECCIRGGGELTGQVDGVLYQCAGWRDEATDEFVTSLPKAIAKLREIIAEQEADETGVQDQNSLERFVLELAEMVAQEPQLLAKANLPTTPTVGNLRRFIVFFATKDARRVLTTVYRCKGDEADLSIVGDIQKFNESWGDFYEDQACRHVAASRGKGMTLFTGALAGTIAKMAQFSDEANEGDE